MEQYTDHNSRIWQRETGSNGLFHPVDPVAVVADQIGFDSDAIEHGRVCLDACDGWEVETLSTNIESNFPHLDENQCDEIASFLLAA